MTDPERDIVFHLVWAELAKLGACDDMGGMEHARVHAEWIEAGRPEACDAFIRQRTNIGPYPA